MRRALGALCAFVVRPDWANLLGACSVLPAETWNEAAPRERRLTEPAPRHPERLVPDAPSSCCERALWEQLSDLRWQSSSLFD
jgi:hypothetical protein